MIIKFLIFFIVNLYSNYCDKISQSFSDAIWSLKISDGKKDIVRCNSEKLLIPASSLKIVTSIYSFEKLGKDFKFKTEIMSDELKNNTVEFFVIKGYGDMTLGSSNFNSSIDGVLNDIYDLIESKKINRIKNLIIDTSLLDDYPESSWEWQDIGNYYAARVSAFSINDNQYSIYFKTYGVGEKTDIIKIYPDPGLKIKNYVVGDLPKTGDNSYIFSNPYCENAVIRGSLGITTSAYIVKGSLPNPSETFLKILTEFLKSKNIIVENANVIYQPLNRKLNVLKTYYSPSLSQIIKVMNKKSFNFYAESLLRYSLLKKGVYGLNENLKELGDFLKEKGIKRFKIVDGSGLSRRNLFSCDGFIKLLEFVKNRDYYNDFYESLIYPGDEDAKGHIKKFGLKYNLNTRIKSGSLNGVRSYVGYVENDGRIYSFCFNVNNYIDFIDTDLFFEELLFQIIKDKK
jgi:D-alanyl-D-alanine carboxypeptidase/D-alanyl-D-alanine-endopeptidase (penicillin-binding protein 4)